MASYNVKTHPAFAGYDLPEANSLINVVRRGFIQAMVWSEKKRAYYRAVAELDALSDRDLADIGIARGEIQAIAHAVAEGKGANA